MTRLYRTLALTAITSALAFAGCVSSYSNDPYAYQAQPSYQQSYVPYAQQYTPQYAPVYGPPFNAGPAAQHTPAAPLPPAQDSTTAEGSTAPPIQDQPPVIVQQAPQQIDVQPVYQQPVYQQPVYQQPVYQQPVYQQPVYIQPAYQPPVVIFQGGYGSNNDRDRGHPNDQHHDQRPNDNAHRDGPARHDSPTILTPTPPVADHHDPAPRATEPRHQGFDANRPTTPPAVAIHTPATILPPPASHTSVVIAAPGTTPVFTPVQPKTQWQPIAPLPQPAPAVLQHDQQSPQHLGPVNSNPPTILFKPAVAPATAVIAAPAIAPAAKADTPHTPGQPGQPGHSWNAGK